MIRTLTCALTISFFCSRLVAVAVTIDTVPVGDPGNPADSVIMDDGTNGYGFIPYEYRIGTYEVTNAQYAAFLNAKAASDPLGLWDENMGGVNPRGGIVRSGTNGNYTYGVKSLMANKPVNYVSWYDSIRFTNWLHNNQGNGDTESGAYTLLGGTPVPSNDGSVIRNSGAKWFLPSENEWYKAAYFQPASNGGDFDDYWHYPTRSNTIPIQATATFGGDVGNPGANVINYQNGADWNSQDGNLTTVGTAGLLSDSYYGTFDQGGNVSEWNEARVGQLGNYGGVRGGAWNTDAGPAAATFRSFYLFSPTLGYSNVGFRVATVPEPSTLILGVLSSLAVLFVRHASKRRRLLPQERI